jgi:hypothetical protein
MNPPAVVRVTDPQGVHGTIDTAAWPLDGSRAEVPVSLEGGPQVWVPVQALIREAEGRYAVPMALADLEWRAGADPREPPLVLPVLAEVLDVQTRTVETGRVRITKVIHEREELVDAALVQEEVIIERVPINRVVDTRLLLKEEVHLTTRRTDTHPPAWVTLRHEDVTIERVDLERHAPHSQGQEESHGEDRDRTL